MAEAGEGGLRLQSTPKLRLFLEKVATVPSMSDKSRELSSKFADGSAIPFGFLRDVYSELRPCDRVPLHRLLCGSSFVLESPKPREKSDELKKRLEKLQEMVDKKKYDELVEDITKHTKEPEYFSSYKEQMGFALHLVVTMLTGFAFGFTVFRSQFRDNPGLHIAGGALGLVIGLLVGTVLFILHDVQREARNMKKKKR